MSEGKPIPVTQALALVSNVGQAATGVVTSILTGVAGAQLDSLRDQLVNYVGHMSSVATVFKSAPIENTDNIVEAEIRDNYQNIITATKAGLGEGVGSLHAAFYEQLIGVNAMLSSYRSLVQRIGVDPYINRCLNQLYTPNIPDAETAWFMNKIGQIDDNTYKAYMKQNGWDDVFVSPLEWSWTRQPPVEMLLNIRRRNLITDDDFKWLLKWYRFSEPVINNITSLTYQLPEPYRLAEFASKGLLDDADFKNAMGWFGIDAHYAETYREVQYQFPSVETLLAELRRGLINDNDFDWSLQRAGVYSGHIPHLRALRDVIPPINDLIRFAVREAFGDHSSEAQYPAMVERAKKMGLTEESSALYWYAHWDRIPVNYMLSNLHRGLWDANKLMNMLRIVDIHPDDRQDIINVAFSPPSIRELGYGYDVGAYSVDDVVKYRRWGGLSPEDAAKSGQAMVLYRTEAERNAIRTANMHLYKLGKITREEFEVAIRAVTPQEAAIQLWLERGDLEYDIAKKPAMDTEGRIVSSSEALTAFKLKLRDEDWTRLALKELDWTQDRIDTAIERAKLEIADTEQKASEVKYRKMTLAQIVDAYKLTIITKEVMTTEMVLIGYNPDDAELLTEIYTRTAPTEVKIKNYTVSDMARLYHYQIFDEDDVYENFLEEGYDDAHAGMLTLLTRLNLDYPILTSLYEKGYINTDELKAELMKMGMSDTDSVLLIQRTQYEYQVSRLATEKELTKAEILKGAKNNVLTPAQASSLLQDLGYDENEAMYILAINKVVAASDPEGYWDMRRVTENYKRARGEKYIVIPDELIMLEKQQKDLKAQLEEAKKHPENEQAIADLTLKLGVIESTMKNTITAKALH